MKGLSPAYIRTGVDMSVFSEEPSRIFAKSELPLPLHVFSCKYSTCGFLLPVHNISSIPLVIWKGALPTVNVSLLDVGFTQMFVMDSQS